MEMNNKKVSTTDNSNQSTNKDTQTNCENTTASEQVKKIRPFGFLGSQNGSLGNLSDQEVKQEWKRIRDGQRLDDGLIEDKEDLQESLIRHSQENARKHGKAKEEKPAILEDKVIPQPENKPFLMAGQTNATLDMRSVETIVKYDGTKPRVVPCLMNGQSDNVRLDTRSVEQIIAYCESNQEKQEIAQRPKETLKENTKDTKDNLKHTHIKNSEIDKSKNINFPVIENKFTNIHSVGNYLYKDGELVYLNPKKEKEVIIGNLWITIITERIYVEEISNEHNEILKYEPHVKWYINIECMGCQFEAEVSVQDLFDTRKLLKLTADRVFLESDTDAKRFFKQYINLLISQRGYYTEYRYKSTGWKRIENSWQYITDMGIIGAENMSYRADVDQHFQYDPNQVDTERTFRDFWNMRCLSKRKVENTVFLMHYSCLSVMTTLFQEIGHGINFVVALIGSTNSQKTATANIFTRLYNRTQKASADIRFDSTAVAVLEKTASYGDAILLIDDILPYDDPAKAKQQKELVTQIIRAYGDRVPRMRSEAYAKINNVSQYSAIKGCCLITGEILDIGFESTATRVIELNFDRGDIDLELLTFYQQHLMNLPTFMYGYIRYIQENLDQILEVIEVTFVEMRHKKFPTTMVARFIDTLAIMYAEVKIFYMYATTKGFLDGTTAQDLINQDIGYIERLVMKNHINSQMHSPAMMILMALKRAIDKREVHCCRLQDIAKASEVNENVVILEDLYISILPAKLWDIYKEYCKMMNKALTYKNGRELVAPLKKENIILIKEEGDSSRSAHKIPETKSQKRFFQIHKSVFEQYCGTFEEF